MSTKKISTVLKNLKVKYGKDSIAFYNDMGKDLNISRVSSGSFAIDKLLGGGWPQGRIIEVFGNESSGKTTLGLSLISEVQRLGKLAAFIDLENGLDPDWAITNGVNMDELVLSYPNCAEDALDILESLVHSGDVGVIVLDSVARLSSRAELEGELGAAHIAIVARLMSQLFRRIVQPVHETGTILYFTNQMRQKVGVTFGSDKVTTGGNALRFYSSIRVETVRAKQIKKGDTTVGNELKITTVKNKTAPAFQSSMIKVYYDQGISEDADIADLMLEAGIAIKQGAMYTLPLIRDLKAMEASGNIALKSYLEDGEERVKVKGFDAYRKQIRQNTNFKTIVPGLLKEK